MEAPVDLNRFVLTMTETAYAQVKAACDGLTDEQFFLPTNYGLQFYRLVGLAYEQS